MGNLEMVKATVKNGRLQDAIGMLNGMIEGDANNDTLYFERGKLYWRMGERSKAMGDYAKAKSINPDSPADKALEQAYDVVNFFNPDLYNP